jgi:hypothetical protein
VNRQEVFNKVATHLLTQGVAATVGGECRYRTDDGKRCAIGCLIPDSLYMATLEGKEIGTVLDANPRLREHLQITEKASGDLDSDENFLSGLQRIHDLYEPYAWGEELNEFATRWDLSVDYGD